MRDRLVEWDGAMHRVNADDEPCPGSRSERSPEGVPGGPLDMQAVDLLPIFLFGTLRDTDLFAAVFGRPQSALACRPAELPDHAAMRVDGADFPVLVAKPRRRQPGLLVDGLAPAEVARAVFYESSGYDLTAVTVRAGGAAVAARAFLPTGRLPASGERWRLAAWQRRHQPRVVAAAHLAMQHFGRLDAAGFDALWPEIETATAVRLAVSSDGGDRRIAAPRRRAMP